MSTKKTKNTKSTKSAKSTKRSKKSSTSIIDQLITEASKTKAFTVITVIILVGAIVWWLVDGLRQSHLQAGSDKTIAVTPEKIAEIKDIGQWEFLSIVDEEVVDTVRHNRIMADDRLSCIYYGTLRLGIDLKYAPKSWAVTRGDTVVVTLPQPRLLDTQFIDEARTNVFYERGRWTAPAKDQMYRRAARRMKARALSVENLSNVRQHATERFEQLFTALGAQHVIVNFDGDDSL